MYKEKIDRLRDRVKTIESRERKNIDHIRCLRKENDNLVNELRNEQRKKRRYCAQLERSLLKEEKVREAEQFDMKVRKEATS